MTKVQELTTRERNEIIGLALDANIEIYHKLLYNEDVFPFTGSNSDMRIAAAIVTVGDWGYADNFIEKINQNYYLMQWERSVVEWNGHEMKLKQFNTKAEADELFAKDADN